LARRALAALALAALAFLAGAAEEAVPEPRREEAARLMNDLMTGRDVGGEFELRDARGRKRRLADFRGKLVLLYFGFTTCPDICPTDLREIGVAVKRLGAKGRQVQPVFVTLDPARDTPGILAEYVRNFHPRFVALTGSEAEVREVARAYKVYFEKVDLPRGLGYTIDHAAFTFLLDRQGKYVGLIPPGTPADRIARIVQAEMQ
jgi:protein SCO1/2